MSILETDTRVNTTFHFNDVDVVKLENECLNDAEPLTPMQNEPKGFNLEEISWC